MRSYHPRTNVGNTIVLIGEKAHSYDKCDATMNEEGIANCLFCWHRQCQGFYHVTAHVIYFMKNSYSSSSVSDWFYKFLFSFYQPFGFSCPTDIWWHTPRLQNYLKPCGYFRALIHNVSQSRESHHVLCQHQKLDCQATSQKHRVVDEVSNSQIVEDCSPIRKCGVLMRSNHCIARVTRKERRSVMSDSGESLYKF
jgi:hypothetical protein